MAETTQSTTSNSSYSAFIPELWSQKLNNMLEKNCVMLQCVNRNWEGEIKNQGDTVKIITPAKVSVSTLTDDNISYSSLAPTSMDLKIDQKKFFAFKIDDVSAVQSNTDIMEAHLSNAKKAIEEVQDSYLLGLHTDVPTANIVGSEESPITLSKTTIYENFVNLALALKNSDAVHSGVRPWVVINPTIESYLLQSSEFISAYNVADETLREGSIGRIAGNLSKLGLTIRGTHGEGTEPKGSLYQLSNQVTLGISEKAAIENLKNITSQLISQEELARERICSNIDIQDSISRSLGILKYARTIAHDEALQLLSNVRLGIVSGQLKDVPLLTIDKLMTDVEPATLMVNSGKNLSAAQRDVARADLLRKALEEV